MMKILNALLLLAACLGSAEDQGPWRHDVEAAAALARDPAGPKPLAVLVSHPSCSWCHRMLDESATAPTVLRAASEVVLTVLDAAERPDLAALLGVRSYPTLVLINRGGKEVRRVSGYLKPEDLSTTLRVLSLNGDSQAGTASALARRIDPTAMAASAEGRGQLAAMLGHGPAGMRAAVRGALATRTEARDLLWPLLIDVSLAVRCDAAAALAGASDDTHGYDPFADAGPRAAQATAWQQLSEGPP
jgi:thioredoxin-related protein